MTDNLPNCRLCGGSDLRSIIVFGETPLADRLLTAEQLDEPELTAPLELAFCPQCSLAQITESVSPEVLFCEDYPYFSSVSPALLEHSRANAEELIHDRHLGAGSLVVELASNDGYLLQYFVEKGVPVLGIEPAKNIARAAEKKGMMQPFPRQGVLQRDGDTRLGQDIRELERPVLERGSLERNGFRHDLGKIGAMHVSASPIRRDRATDCSRSRLRQGYSVVPMSTSLLLGTILKSVRLPLTSYRNAQEAERLSPGAPAAPGSGR